jgi:hypothetical protein
LYNIILQRAQLQLIDETTGMPRPLLSFQQVQKMIQDLIGLPIESALDEANKMKQQYPQAFGQQMQQQQKQQPLGMNGNIGGVAGAI